MIPISLIDQNVTKIIKSMNETKSCKNQNINIPQTQPGVSQESLLCHCFAQACLFLSPCWEEL